MILLLFLLVLSLPFTIQSAAKFRLLTIDDVPKVGDFKLMIVSGKLDVNATDMEGNTVAHELINIYRKALVTEKLHSLYNLICIVKVIYDANFDANIRNKNGDSILDLTVKDRDHSAEELIPVLLEGKEFENVDKAFFYSQRHGLLIVQQKSISLKKNIMDVPLLAIAAFRLNLELTIELLKREYIDINDVDDNGNTALHYVVFGFNALCESEQQAKFETTKAIITAIHKANANVNIKNRAELTALDLTLKNVHNNPFILVPFLLTLKFDNVERIFYAAIETYNPTILSILVEDYSCNINDHLMAVSSPIEIVICSRTDITEDQARLIQIFLNKANPDTMIYIYHRLSFNQYMFKRFMDSPYLQHLLGPFAEEPPSDLKWSSISNLLSASFNAGNLAWFTQALRWLHKKVSPELSEERRVLSKIYSSPCQDLENEGTS